MTTSHQLASIIVGVQLIRLLGMGKGLRRLALRDQPDSLRQQAVTLLFQAEQQRQVSPAAATLGPLVHHGFTDWTPHRYHTSSR